MKKLFALRGATQCENTVKDICDKIAVLYDELLSKNKLDEKDIVSVIFSVTDDLNEVNPSCALRKTGRGGDLALFSVREAQSRGDLERTLRAIIHCYLEDGSAPHHVYQNGAEVLRPDRKL